MLMVLPAYGSRHEMCIERGIEIGMSIMSIIMLCGRCGRWLILPSKAFSHNLLNKRGGSDEH